MMEWLNIHASILDSEAFVGCEPVARATWLCLLRYCVSQENGGRITDCREWGDRRWQQTVRVTLPEVMQECPLWKWDGADLVVAFYPSDKEKEIQAKREAVKFTNLRRNSSPTPPPEEGTEQKGMEGKGREGQRDAQRDAQREQTQPYDAEASSTYKKTECDADWVKKLGEQPEYSGIDVSRELGKMKQWCSVNRKQPSRRRFINWLNHCDSPMQITDQSTAPDHWKNKSRYDMICSEIKAIEDRSPTDAMQVMLIPQQEREIYMNLKKHFLVMLKNF